MLYRQSRRITISDVDTAVNFNDVIINFITALRFETSFYKNTFANIIDISLSDN